MENLSKKPAKGILKSSSSFEQSETLPPRQQLSTDKDIKWDEINILQTLHPPDKDYGHMKIDEPKTPYSYETEGVETSDNADAVDAGTLLDKLTKQACELPKVLAGDDESEEDEEELTEEEKRKKREFEIKRKIHYNEFQAVKLARKLLKDELLKEDEEDEDDETANKDTINNESSCQSVSNVNGAKSSSEDENR